MLLTGLCILNRMSKAARAVIFEHGNLLVMHRNKHGNEYFTLVGGRVQASETIEQALVREVEEETGLRIVGARLVFIEEHPEPYNEQYIFYCTVAAHNEVAIQTASEEGFMNRIGINTHAPVWTSPRAFASLPFRTPQLQAAIIEAFAHGFPDQPRYL